MSRQNRQQRGFSLIELMVAITIGMLLVAAIASIFVASSRSYTQDDRYARLQENGRFALHALAQEISMAGFWGLLSSNFDTVTSLGNTCGDASAVNLNLRTPLKVVNSSNGTDVNAVYTCINAASFVTGTDMLIIKRVHAGQTASGHETGAPYLRVTGNSSATLLQYSGTGPDPSQTDWRYLVHIYHVANKLGASGQTVPALYRRVLRTDLSTQAEEMAEGIENIQFQFGIDTDATPDGIVDYFTSSPAATELGRIFVVRINVLARAVDPDPDPTYVNNKTYALGDTAVGPFTDRYHRQVYTTTVSVRNLSYQARS